MDCGEFYEFVFARGSFVHQKCSSHALTNLLFSLCKSMWVIDLLVNILSPGAPTHPITWSVANQGTHLNFFPPSVVVTFWLANESIKELGVCQIWPNGWNILAIWLKYFIQIFFVGHKFMLTSSCVNDIEYIVNTFNRISNLYSSHYNNNPLASKGDFKVF